MTAIAIALGSTVLSSLLCALAFRMGWRAAERHYSRQMDQCEHENARLRDELSKLEQRVEIQRLLDDAMRDGEDWKEL